MRLLWIIVSLLPLAAQTPATTPAAQTPSPQAAKAPVAPPAAPSATAETRPGADAATKTAAQTPAAPAAQTPVTLATQTQAPPAAKAPVPPAAQTPAPATAPDAKAETKPDAAADTKTAPPAKAEASPVPVEAAWVTGSIDLGYRWRTGVAGSFDTYRSIVNLGSGPKLLGADFSIVDPKRRAFDQIRVRASSWGDDPNSTFHLDAKKEKLYDFNADYRNIAYFNFLLSFADPLLARGIVLNEQSFDTHRRFASFQLDLLPGNWFVPYLAYDHDSGSGRGTTTFVSDANEYAVPNTLRDRTNLYRGGVRIELRRFHVTLEEGGTTFRDDQSVYTASSATNFGNLSTPFFGQRLSLSSLLASYGIRGNSTYSKALFTANATSWLDLYGQFLFSQPESNVNYRQSDTGNFLLQSQLLFYNSQQYLLSSAAKLPHTSASFGAEIRPMSRVRIVESWLTDRLHESGSATSSQVLLPLGPSGQTSALLASSLATTYSQEEIDLFVDVTSRLTLRGGYRYVWGEASDATLLPAGLKSADQGKLRRHVGIGGMVFRPSQKLSISGEMEGGSSGGAYFRTSLYDYRKVRARARYQASTSLSLSADFLLLNNQNPLPMSHYDYLALQESLSFLWSPGAGKTWDFQGSYSRSSLRSDISYLVPQILQAERSSYRDNAHTVTALFSASLPAYAGLAAPKFSAGGAFFFSSGSRPTSYYQPVAKLFVPVRKNLSWFTEWQYYGYGEAFYLYEGFRTHLLTTGLRLTR